MWLQVLFPTKQQPPRPDSTNQLIWVSRLLIDLTTCAWLVATKSFCGIVIPELSYQVPLYTPCQCLHHSKSRSCVTYCCIVCAKVEFWTLPSPGIPPTASPQRSGLPCFSWWPSRVFPPPAPCSCSRWLSLKEPKTDAFMRKKQKLLTLGRICPGCFHFLCRTLRNSSENISGGSITDPVMFHPDKLL